MARQRLVKPEFFQHEELCAAEFESGLQLRVAFVGLWCYADRRGLFAWKPMRLKLNILPFDNLDFSRVLDALESAGFIRSYVVNGQRFGCIPSFAKHQTFHAREYADRTIPDEPGTVPAPDKPKASTGRARGRKGASPTVTVTVTGTDKGTDTGTGTKELPAMSWVEEARRLWGDKVGPVSHGRVGSALKELVDVNGWDAVVRGLGDYLTATPLAKAKLEWFAERGSYWVKLAAQPLVDPETCQPTERARVVVYGGAA